MGMDPVPGTLGDVLVDVSDPPPQATMLSVQAKASAARVSFSEEPEGWFCFWEVAARDRVSQAKEEGDVVLDMSVDHDELKQTMQITYPAATHSCFWGRLDSNYYETGFMQVLASGSAETGFCATWPRDVLFVIECVASHGCHRCRLFRWASHREWFLMK